jgi:hypothetical protein
MIYDAIPVIMFTLGEMSRSAYVRGGEHVKMYERKKEQY